MAIKLDEDNKVVVYENEPEEARSMFPNIPTASKIEGGVKDVLIDGTSIVDENGDANIPKAASGTLGVVKVVNAQSYGIKIDSFGTIDTNPPSASRIKEGLASNQPLVPASQHTSVFYGLAKAAGDTTQALSDNAVGTYTDDAKVAIRNMIGATSKDWALIQETVVAEDNTQSVTFVIPSGVSALRIYCKGSNITANRNISFMFNNLNRNFYINSAQSIATPNVIFEVGEVVCGTRIVNKHILLVSENNKSGLSDISACLTVEHYFGGNTITELKLTADSLPWNTGDTISVYGLK